MFDPDVLERNDRPLQRPGADELLREDYFPPRGHTQDARFILDAEALRALLDVAQQSITGRVVMHNASLRLRTWRGGDGKVYTTLGVLATEAVPEDPSIVRPRGEDFDLLGLRR